MIPYPAYKSTNLPWLPKIPEHWEIRKLRHLLSLVSTKNRPDMPLLSVVREKGVILRDVSNKEENHNYIPDDLSNYKLVKKGQFVMNKMKAWQGSYGVSDYDGIVSPAYFVFNLHGVMPSFFHRALRSKQYVPYFGQASDGIRVGQWDLSIPRMKEIPFAVPPPPEQEQIVRYLDSMTAKINKLIRAKKKQIALLQEQRQAIINHAVTKGLNPNVEMKDSGIDWIGEIPKHWIINKVSWIFGFIGSGTTPPNDNQHLFYENGTIPWINSGDLYQNDKFIQKIARKVTTNALMSCSALKQYPKGTIVIAMYGASIGNMGITIESACCNQACCCLSMPKCSLSIDFAYYLLSSCKKHWVEQSYGGGQQNISQEIIKSTRIPIPPKEEQIQIVSYLDANLRKLNNLISQCEHTIILLQEYKNSLISSVVTGRTDVRNIPVVEVIPDDLISEDVPASEIEEEPPTNDESEE